MRTRTTSWLAQRVELTPAESLDQNWLLSGEIEELGETRKQTGDRG